MPQIDQLTLLREATSLRGAGPVSMIGEPDASEAWKWGRLTESPRDLPAYKHQRAQEISEYLYRANPIAHRILELTRDFVVGGGMTFRAREERVQKLLTEFWNHPRNRWPLKFPQRILEFYIYGEQLWRTDVDSTGRVFVIAIPPLDIEEIMPSVKNPEEPFRAKLADGSLFQKSRGRGKSKRELDIIQADRDPNSASYGYRKGEALFFRNNPLTGAWRGYPELLPLSDWLDSYDQFGFLRMDRAAYLLTWFWDVTLAGYTQEEIDLWLAENLLLRPTQPGSILAHNESVTWNPITPKLEAKDASSESQELRRIITAGAGFPMGYLGGGDTGGRTAEALAVEPTHRTLVQKQEEIRNMMIELFDFVIDQAMFHGLISEKENREFIIGLPRIALRDVMRIGGAMARISEALEKAQTNKWVSDEWIASTFKQLMEDLAVQLPKQEKEER